MEENEVTFFIVYDYNKIQLDINSTEKLQKNIQVMAIK